MKMLREIIRREPGCRVMQCKAPARPQPTRPIRELYAIRERHGSAFLAALAGAIHAEEFLKLTNWEMFNEH